MNGDAPLDALGTDTHNNAIDALREQHEDIRTTMQRWKDARAQHDAERVIALVAYVIVACALLVALVLGIRAATAHAAPTALIEREMYIATASVETRSTDDYSVPAHAIADVDAPKQQCIAPPGGTTRLCKVPASLVPVFERVARDNDIPVALLLAIASWETGFRTDAHTNTSEESSCGMYQFNTWRTWGFATLDDCYDPEQATRKVAEAMQKFRALGGKIDNDNLRWYACRHNAGRSAGLRCARSLGYGKAVEWGARNVYASDDVLRDLAK